MDEIKTFLESKEEIKNNYEMLTVNHPKIEEQYGVISIIKIKLNNKSNTPLLVFPGYSNNSFKSGFDVVLTGLDHLKSKYSVMYFVCWGLTIKQLSKDYSAGAKNQEDEFKLNDELKLKIAKVFDKILRSPDMELTNITLLCKSAGGGVGIFLTSMNSEIKNLFMAAPALTARGTPLADRKDLNIKLSWCKDDPDLPYKVNKEYIVDLKKQGNKYKFFSYDKGGHEFNSEFIKII
jgi:hypothetical protein